MIPVDARDRSVFDIKTITALAAAGTSIVACNAVNTESPKPTSTIDVKYSLSPETFGDNYPENKKQIDQWSSFTLNRVLPGGLEEKTSMKSLTGLTLMIDPETNNIATIHNQNEPNILYSIGVVTFEKSNRDQINYRILVKFDQKTNQIETMLLDPDSAGSQSTSREYNIDYLKDGVARPSGKKLTANQNGEVYIKDVNGVEIRLVETPVSVNKPTRAPTAPVVISQNLTTDYQPVVWRPPTIAAPSSTPEKPTVTISPSATTRSTDVPRPTATATEKPKLNFNLPLMPDGKGGVKFDFSASYDKLPVPPDLSSQFIQQWHDYLENQSGLVKPFGANVCKLNWLKVVGPNMNYYRLDRTNICQPNTAPFEAIAALYKEVPGTFPVAAITFKFYDEKATDPQKNYHLVTLSIPLDYTQDSSLVKVFNTPYNYLVIAWDLNPKSGINLTSVTADGMKNAGWYNPDEVNKAMNQMLETGIFPKYLEQHVLLGSKNSILMGLQ
jgi:hypothetical protein